MRSDEDAACYCAAGPRTMGSQSVIVVRVVSAIYRVRLEFCDRFNDQGNVDPSSCYYPAHVRIAPDPHDF